MISWSAFHLFIISTFPLAVPLEWNVLFAYAAVFLFLGLPDVARLRRRRHVVAVADGGDRRGLVFFPILGNLRPDLVSFLPSMRQYAGNWASARVGVRPGRGGEAEQGHALRAATRSTS